MKKTVTWILIANGAQARIVEYTGPGKGLRQVDGMEWAIEPLMAHELVTDRPGGNRIGGMEPRTDPVEHREAEFVKSVTAALERPQQNGAFDRLVIVAAPIALGDIRKTLSPGVKKLVVGELNKDLTNLPNSQLDKHLDGILAM